MAKVRFAHHLSGVACLLLGGCASASSVTESAQVEWPRLPGPGPSQVEADRIRDRAPHPPASESTPPILLRPRGQRSRAIAIYPGREIVPTIPYEGLVLATDGTRNVHLISVGARAGVQAGHELTVHRDGHFIAMVLVDRVFEDRASVIVERVESIPLKKSEIRAGDRVSWASGDSVSGGY